MRKAIQDTNVVLNMAITPGIILIPSNMIILKDRLQQRLDARNKRYEIWCQYERELRCTDDDKTTCSCYTGEKTTCSYSKSTGQPSPLPFGKYDRDRFFGNEIRIVKKNIS